MGKRCLTNLFLCAALIISAAPATEKEVYAQDQKPTEYEVKAAFIYNFAKFIEWPPAPSHPYITVCVFGRDPFGPAFNVIEDKTVGDRKIMIRRNASFQNFGDCNILFIGNSEKERLPHIFEALSGLSVLTIGDTTGFARQGVMINFFIEDKTVRFEINREAAARAGLRISSKLLRIARLVGGP